MSGTRSEVIVKRTAICALALALVGSAHSWSQTPQSAFAGKPDAATPDAANTGKTAASALEAAREDLRKAEAEHPGNTAQVANALHVLVGCEIDAELLDRKSLDEAEREARMAEAVTGAKSKAFVAALDDQAEVLIRLSRAADARPPAERGFAIAQKEFSGTADAANAASELGTTCTALGDYSCALRAFQLAIDTTRKISGNDSVDLMEPLNELGSLKSSMGDKEGAIETDEEALRIAYRVKPDDPNIAIIENNLGSHYSAVNKLDKALEHLNKSVQILDKYFGLGSPLDMQVRHNLASVYTQAGHFDAAWKGYEFSLQNKLEQVDMQAITHWMYALSLAQGGKPERAVDEGLTSARMGREMFVLQARTLPERQALAYEATRARGLEIAISEALKHPELPIADIYKEAIRSRALVADEMAHRQKNLNANNDPDTARLLNDLNKARTDLLAVEHSGSLPASPADTAEAATARMESIERALAERSAALRADEQIYQATTADLRRNLPANSVLISYVLYRRRAVDHVDPENTKTPSYAAFVIHPDSDRIALFDLGEAASLDELVRKARSAADAEAHSGGLGSTRNERSYREAALAIRQRVWDPLKAEIGAASLALVVADGNLNLIPFAGLPEGDGYLVEHGPVIHTLSSERDLTPAEPGPKKQGLLAIGSPSFELAANQIPPSRLRGAVPTCEEFTKIEFQPLPGTEDEISDLRSNWRKWNPDEPAQMIVGDDATLSRFMEDATHSRVLHVATHAFLLDKRCGSGNPLMHSGLVFAGGGRGGGQSILLAQQIASLDLTGVDWAVLSACNTGNGELHDGEGVLGLQRAFREAGARSVIMTLWPVDDDAARRFMHELYAERLRRHASTADSVWNSARAMLLERRAAGKSTHPWYWAGFVGAGGWE